MRKRPAWPDQSSRRPRRRGRVELTVLLALVSILLTASACSKKWASAKPLPPSVAAEPPPVPPPPSRGPVSVPQTQAELPPPQPVPDGAEPPTRGPLPAPAREPMGPPVPAEAEVAVQEPQPAPERPAVAPPDGRTPVPALQQVLTASERQQYNQVIDSRIAQTRESLRRLNGRSLDQDQKSQFKRIQVFLRQAGEARTQNPALASNLAERARLLAEDLARNFR